MVALARAMATAMALDLEKKMNIRKIENEKK